MQFNAFQTLAFLVIMAVIAAGMLHFSWWAAVSGASLLGLISLTSREGGYARYYYSGSSIALPTILISSTLNASATASAAFIVGQILAWYWGL